MKLRTLVRTGAAAVVGILVLGGGGIAYAYFSASGSGTGTAGVGSGPGAVLQLTSAGPSTPLTPWDGSQPSTYPSTTTV